jgi:hypothetical protein
MLLLDIFGDDEEYYEADYENRKRLMITKTIPNLKITPEDDYEKGMWEFLKHNCAQIIDGIALFLQNK